IESIVARRTDGETDRNTRNHKPTSRNVPTADLWIPTWPSHHVNITVVANIATIRPFTMLRARTGSSSTRLNGTSPPPVTLDRGAGVRYPTNVAWSDSPTTLCVS